MHKPYLAFYLNAFTSVQLLSPVWPFVTPWTSACQTSLSITNSQSLLKLMSIKSVMPSNHLILCHPLFPPSIFPSFKVFSSESVLCIMWPKCWEFQFQHQSFQWIFRTDFLLGWTGWITLQSKGLSRVFNSTFKSINTLLLNFLYSPALTSIHDYWKNYSFDQTDLYWQSNVSAF